MRQMIAALLLALLLTACGGAEGEEGVSFRQIDQETALEMMTEETVILDVREQEEYDSGHIPGAVLLPVGTIDEASAASVIPEADTRVLVYCRSGNRSVTAAQALAELGYTEIYEFGGIRDWPYDIVTE